MKFEVHVDGRVYQLEVASGERQASVPRKLTPVQSTLLPTPSTDENAHVCRSPVNGVIVRVNAHLGEQLRQHDPLLVLEAMKMETTLTAPISGRVKDIHVTPGQAVKANEILAELE